MFLLLEEDMVFKKEGCKIVSIKSPVLNSGQSVVLSKYFKEDSQN